MHKLLKVPEPEKHPSGPDVPFKGADHVNGAGDKFIHGFRSILTLPVSNRIQVFFSISNILDRTI